MLTRNLLAFLALGLAVQFGCAASSPVATTTPSASPAAQPLPATSEAAAGEPQDAPNIQLGGSLNGVKRGGTATAIITMDIPSGYHVNSNRPLGKYAVPTVLKVTAPAGVRIGAVSYPRGVTRNFKFSSEKLSVYEGRATMRVPVTVPANYKGRIELTAALRYQSCSDEVCFRPANKEVGISANVN